MFDIRRDIETQKCSKCTNENYLLRYLEKSTQKILATLYEDGSGGDVITDKTKVLMLELAQLIYKQTENKKFTRHICLFMDTDDQMEKLIRFIKENNPTLNEINHRSFDIVFGGE